MTTKRVFEMVARAVRDEVCVYVDDENVMRALRAMASHLANQFADDNPRFDRDRFLKACGFPV